MALDEVQEPKTASRLEAELARLRRELAAAEDRLEEQAAYYRSELESRRQRVEGEHLRAEAQEVARRRRAEEQVVAMKVELRQARDEIERARRRAEQAEQRLKEAELAAERKLQAEVERVQQAAKMAWRGAEEELAKVEEELGAVRRLLDQERERNKKLEETVSRLRAAPPVDQDLLAQLKEALWATAQARKRAEAELVALKSGAATQTAPQAAQAETKAEAFEGAYRVVSGSEWKDLKIADGNVELNEAFLIMPGDASLDEETFQRVQDLVPDPEPSPKPERPRTKPAARKPVSPAKHTLSTQIDLPPLRQAPADEPRPSGKGWLIAVVAVSVSLIALLVWLFASGGFSG